MSLRLRKVLTAVARSLALDLVFLSYEHWGRHVSWSGMAFYVKFVAMVNVVTVVYTWWWYRDPRREERARTVRRERDERARLK